MDGVTIEQKGDYRKVTGWLERIREKARVGILDKYGKEGVAALSAATPIDSGKTAASWYYKIQNENGSATLTFSNRNVNKSVKIAVILQYGHGTRNGGWVEGRNYINPAIQPLFDKIANEAWKEVTTV